MNKVIRLLKKTFFATTALYTLSSLFIFLVFFTSSEENPVFTGAVTLQLYCLLFAFISSVGFTLFGELKINNAIKYILEFIVSYAGFYLSVFYLTGNTKQYSAFFAFSTVFVLVYAVCGALVLLTNKLESEKKSSKEYKEIYSEIK